MPDFADDGAAAKAESRLWRRLGRSFVSADSWVVLPLVVATYVVSISVIAVAMVVSLFVHNPGDQLDLSRLGQPDSSWGCARCGLPLFIPSG